MNIEKLKQVSDSIVYSKWFGWLSVNSDMLVMYFVMLASMVIK